MYEDLRGRLEELAKIELHDDGMGVYRISAEGLEIIKGLAQEAEAAIEDLSEQINERKTTPPETGEPTVYELQILANQVTIMGALAVIFPEKGDQEILQNMLQGAKNTRELVVSVMLKEDAWLK